MDSLTAALLPAPSSTLAGEVDELFSFILWVSVAIFGLVLAAIVYLCVRYRRRGKAGLTYGKDHNLPIEIIWTAIPTVLIMIVFVWGFRTFIKLNVVPHDAMEVKVTGQSWFWTFDYPEGASSVNELVVPVNKPIKLLMSSTDVIHSLFVPNFRIKMDLVPNRYSIAWFEATKQGEYVLYCAEYCGQKHSEMLATVKVVTDSDYLAWLEAKSVLGAGLSLEEYGKELYTTMACVTCHSIDGSIVEGPSFLNVFGHEVLFKDGNRLVADENYLRESILDPQAKIVSGYQPVMPTFQGILKERQVDALIAFIKTLNDGQEK